MYVSLSTCGFQHPPGIENEFRYRYLSILLIRSFGLRVKVLVFNITFINISVISRRSVLLIEDTGVPEVNHRPVASHWQNFKTPCKTLTLLYISQSLSQCRVFPCNHFILRF